jgi:hypothetical protein
MSLNNLNIINPNTNSDVDPIIVENNDDVLYYDSYISDIGITRNNVLVAGVSRRLSGEARNEENLASVPVQGKLVTFKLTNENAPGDCCNAKKCSTTNLEPAISPVNISGGMNITNLSGFRNQTRYGEIVARNEFGNYQVSTVISLHGSDSLFGIGFTSEANDSLSLNSSPSILKVDENAVLQGTISASAYGGSNIFLAPISNVSINSIEQRPAIITSIFSGSDGMLTELVEEPANNFILTANNLTTQNRPLANTILPNYYSDIDFAESLYFGSVINNNQSVERKNPEEYSARE